jgi:hypothetical protein
MGRALVGMRNLREVISSVMAHWWSSFSSIRCVIRPVINPSNFLIPEEDDGRGGGRKRQQQIKKEENKLLINK